jgi:hypothetical protein
MMASNRFPARRLVAERPLYRFDATIQGSSTQVAADEQSESDRLASVRALAVASIFFNEAFYRRAIALSGGRDNLELEHGNSQRAPDQSGNFHSSTILLVIPNH